CEARARRRPAARAGAADPRRPRARRASARRRPRRHGAELPPRSRHRGRPRGGSHPGVGLRQDPDHLRARAGGARAGQRRRPPGVRVFEICRTYKRALGGDTETTEPRWVALALAGARAAAAWHTPPAAADVYDAKGLAELVAAEFGLAPEARTGGKLSGFEPD